jgi:hypothetical protein
VAVIYLAPFVDTNPGVFGVPLELLVERDGFDSTLGVSRTPLRVPSFLDDLISAMRQMGEFVVLVFIFFNSLFQTCQWRVYFERVAT